MVTGHRCTSAFATSPPCRFMSSHQPSMMRRFSCTKSRCSPFLAISDCIGLLNLATVTADRANAHLFAPYAGADLLGAPLPPQCRLYAPSAIFDIPSAQPTAPGRVPNGRCQSALHVLDASTNSAAEAPHEPGRATPMQSTQHTAAHNPNAREHPDVVCRSEATLPVALIRQARLCLTTGST